MKKKITKIILNIIFVLTISLTLYIAIFGSIASKNGDVLKFFSYSYSYVPSKSMKGDYTKDDYIVPSFDKGSFLLLKTAKFSSLEVGDVIVYNDNNILKVHRIISYNEFKETFIVKGDNLQATQEDEVDQSLYRAKVVKILFTLNSENNFLLARFIIISVFVVILLIVFVWQIFKITKDKNQAKLDQLKAKQAEELTKLKEELYQEVSEQIKEIQK